MRSIRDREPSPTFNYGWDRLGNPRRCTAHWEMSAEGRRPMAAVASDVPVIVFGAVAALAAAMLAGCVASSEPLAVSAAGVTAEAASAWAAASTTTAT